MNYFKGKKILVTAGPTWVKLDPVRIISNTATGETGRLLAEKLEGLSAKVTLVFGPGELKAVKGIRVRHFSYYDQLKQIISDELQPGDYDIMVHSAAVSDYKPLECCPEKIPSGKKILTIKLSPTEKIIDMINPGLRGLFLVGFKFEPQAGKEILSKEARKLIQSSGAGLVVANTVRSGKYLAYIVSKNYTRGPFQSKESMADGLIRAIEKFHSTLPLLGGQACGE